MGEDEEGGNDSLDLQEFQHLTSQQLTQPKQEIAVAPVVTKTMSHFYI